MPPRKRFSGDALCQLLSRHGFVRVRQKGSHVVMQQGRANSTKTVIIPMHKDLKPGTLGSIIRQSGLPRSLFDE